MVLKAKVAIELTDELAESPTWRASCWCLPHKVVVPPKVICDDIDSLEFIT